MVLGECPTSTHQVVSGGRHRNENRDDYIHNMMAVCTPEDATTRHSK